MWKKRIVAMIVIFVLVGMALAFPFIINYYSDKSHMNKIQYVESKDIDVISVSNNKDVASNLKIMDGIVQAGIQPGFVELNSKPSEEMINRIDEKVRSEMHKWFDQDVMGFRSLGIDLSMFCDFSIDWRVLYSLSGYKNIAFWEIGALCNDDLETTLVIYMDSNNYKIYSVTIQGKIVGKKLNSALQYVWAENNFYDANIAMDSYEEKISIDTTTEIIAKRIAEYYNIEVPTTIDIGENIIAYTMFSTLQWSLKISDDEYPYLSIGITELF